MSLEHPHDRYFKESFGNLKLSKEFLTHYLPVEVLNMADLDSLKLEKDSFVDENLQEYYSDLLFSVDWLQERGYFYLLFEHKSSVDHHIVLQLLKYLLAIWERKKQKEKRNKLPIIIPMVFYHGSKRWTAARSLAEQLEHYDQLPEEIRRFIPNFEYQLYDFSAHSQESLRGSELLRRTLEIFRDFLRVSDADLVNFVIERAQAVFREGGKEDGEIYFRTLIHYAYYTKEISTEQFQELYQAAEATLPEGGGTVMTTLAKRLLAEGEKLGLEKGEKLGLQKGEKLGLQKGEKLGLEKGEKLGLQKGAAQEKEQTARKLLTIKFGELPPEFAVHLTNLRPEQYDAIIVNIFRVQSLEEVLAYLEEH